jgi:mono/diheme cytochrome c family protein
MRIDLIAGVVLIIAVLVTATVEAAGRDLHLLWDDRCAECHGHAGAFARRFLSVVGAQLQGRHHVHDLRRFLHNHYLADSEVDAVYTMLLDQASTQARFKNDCSGCHKSAVQLVRNSLELRHGELYSRSSGHLVRHYLDHHRDLDPDDVEFFTKLLTRVAHEAYRP